MIKLQIRRILFSLAVLALALGLAATPVSAQTSQNVTVELGQTVVIKNTTTGYSFEMTVSYGVTWPSNWQNAMKSFFVTTSPAQQWANCVGYDSTCQIIGGVASMRAVDVGWLWPHYQVQVSVPSGYTVTLKKS